MQLVYHFSVVTFAHVLTHHSTYVSTYRPLFDPKMIDLNATTLLRFLKENCATEGHTYLLYREEGGKTVQLYDVTALSAERQRRWKWLLAMLAYRFAMRIYQQVQEQSHIYLFTYLYYVHT